MIIVSFTTCQKPPEWPDAPFIEQAKGTDYIKQKGAVAGSISFDTVRVHLNFRDGNGDLGLERDGDTLEPYNAYDYIKDSNGDYIKIQDNEVFNIFNFTDDLDVDGDNIKDTVRIKINLYKDNVLFDFVRVNALGDIIDTVDFSKLNNGLGVLIPNFRFEPLYKKDYSDEVYEGPLDGTITAEIVSSFAALAPGNYRINVKIVDRALNVSNEILTTPAFTKE